VPGVAGASQRMNLNNPCRKDHPERKLVNGLMINPFDDLDVAGSAHFRSDSNKMTGRRRKIKGKALP